MLRIKFSAGRQFSASKSPTSCSCGTLGTSLDRHNNSYGKIKNYQQFIEDVANRNFKPYVKRFQELDGIRPTGMDAKETYLIEVTFDFGSSLLENESIKNFKRQITGITFTRNQRTYLSKRITMLYP
ncbi:MAG: hypothetical protein IPJ66_10935 [Bacteroidetes bacterium]|nr:hypothetical protein [Bacteroidota bacterium]